MSGVAWLSAFHHKPCWSKALQLFHYSKATNIALILHSPKFLMYFIIMHHLFTCYHTVFVKSMPELVHEQSWLIFKCLIFHLVYTYFYFYLYSVTSFLKSMASWYPQNKMDLYLYTRMKCISNLFVNQGEHILSMP